MSSTHYSYMLHTTRSKPLVYAPKLNTKDLGPFDDDDISIIGSDSGSEDSLGGTPPRSRLAFLSPSQETYEDLRIQLMRPSPVKPTRSPLRGRIEDLTHHFSSQLYLSPDYSVEFERASDFNGEHSPTAFSPLTPSVSPSRRRGPASPCPSASIRPLAISRPSPTQQTPRLAGEPDEKDRQFNCGPQIYSVCNVPVITGESVALLDQESAVRLPKDFPTLDDILYDKLSEVRPSDIHGMGLFARKELRYGETIVTEHPVIVTPYIGDCSSVEQAFNDLLHRLSPPALKQLMSMVESIGDDDDVEDVHEAILRVNALAVQLYIPVNEDEEVCTHRGIFLKASRCNHSCGPNANWTWDAHTFSLTLTAVRTIKPDEEITIPYISPHSAHEVRNEILKTCYGFECQCLFCLLPAQSLAESDSSRHFIRTFWLGSTNVPSFERWCNNPFLYDDDLLLSHHLKAFEVIQREGLEIFDLGPGEHLENDLGRHADVIAMCYGALGDVDRFQVWIERALQARSNARPDQRLALSSWLSNPLSFPVWGWRSVKHAGRRLSRGGQLEALKESGLFMGF